MDWKPAPPSLGGGCAEMDSRDAQRARPARPLPANPDHPALTSGNYTVLHALDSGYGF